MAHARHHRGRFRSRRRLARFAALVLVMAVAAGGWGYMQVADSTRLASLSAALLQEMTGARVHIASATLQSVGVVDLRGVRMTVDDMLPDAGRLIDIEHVRVQFDPWSLLRGRFIARQMTLTRPVLSLTYDADRGLFNYQKLRAATAGMDRDLSKLALPRVVVRDGRLMYGEVKDGQSVSIGEGLAVGGLMLPAAEDRGDTASGAGFETPMSPAAVEAGLYEFRLQRLDEDAAGGPVTMLQGSIDLKTLGVQMEMKDFAFIDPHKNMLPEMIRQWWEDLKLVGSLPRIAFSYDAVAGPSASVRLQDVGLSLPLRFDGEYVSPMTGVSGAIHFAADRIRIESLRGEIEGLQYEINGEILGYSPDAPLRLRLETEPFDIPDKPRYLVGLPRQIQKLFRMFTPVGSMQVAMTLNRGEPGQGLQYDGVAHILSGTGYYSKFPYPLSNCRGTIAFNEKVIEVLELTGDAPGGGMATIFGTVSPPSEQAALDLTVMASAVRFDDVLRDAFPDRIRAAYELFYDRPQYERLVQSGVIRPAGSAEPSEAPEFDMGGRGDVTVSVTRDFGDDQPIDIAADIDLEYADVVFRFFPYPVRTYAGRLKVTDESAVFEGVRFTGLTGGEGRLEGRVAIPPKDSGHLPQPDLQLTVADVPVNGLLTAALPRRHAGMLAFLDPVAGRMNVDCRIGYDEAMRLPTYHADVALSDAVARLGGTPFELTAVAGRFAVDASGVQVEKLTGRRGDGVVEVTGSIRHGEQAEAGDRPQLRLAIEGRGLRFEDHVLELAAAASGLLDDARANDAATADGHPAADGDPVADAGGAAPDMSLIASLWRRYQPVGTFDAAIAIDTHAAVDQRYRIHMTPRSLALVREGRVTQVGGMSGDVVVTPAQIELRQIAGEIDGVKLAAAGVITTGPEPVIRLDALSVSVAALSPDVMALLPDKARAIAEAVKLDGHIEATFENLLLQSGQIGGDSLRGSLRIREGSCDLGVAVRDFDGTARFAVGPETTAGQWPAITLHIGADRVYVADRLVESLQVVLHNEQSRGELAIERLDGRLYGGAVTGRGVIGLADPAFHVGLAFSDVDLARFVEAGQVRGAAAADFSPPRPATQGAVRKPMRGLITANLALQGDRRDLTRTLGRGDVLIHEATLYDLPLTLGLLQVTHLTLPSSRSFDKMLAGYYVKDGVVTFEKLEMRSPTVQLSGGGTMDYRTRKLNLTLTTSNPAGLNLGVVTELVDKFRDQLATIHITGTLDRPTHQVRQFDGITRAWRDVFGGVETEP